MNRRLVLKMAGGGAVLLIAVASGFPALAANDRIYTGLVSGVAVGGYDAVAYFTEKKPVRGSKDITAKHAGVTWRFASNANRLKEPNLSAIHRKTLVNIVCEDTSVFSRLSRMVFIVSVNL